MLHQFNTHCDQHNLLPDFQSVNRKNYSKETALIKLLNEILWAMETKSIMAVTILDLSATFDTVNNDLLVDILNKTFGISEIALQWFENYLRPRSIKVCVNKTYSNEKSLAFSVQQGSCSEANIFTAYCSPIGEIIPDSAAISGFADDHLIQKSFLANSRTQVKEVFNELESSMKDIKSWMDSMRLKRNSDRIYPIWI